VRHIRAGLSDGTKSAPGADRAESPKLERVLVNGSMFGEQTADALVASDF